MEKFIMDEDGHLSRNTDYEIENKFIQRQVKYAEGLIERKMTNWEKQLFEWAYIQGKEDYKEGKTK